MIETYLPIFFKGFGLTAGLIMVIGVQNVYVLRHGLLRQHLWLITLTCWLSDVLLITLGVLSMGRFLEHNVLFMALMSLVGFCFLTLYAWAAARSAIRGGTRLPKGVPQVHESALKVFLTTLALTYLNPHTYLDTVLLLGGLGAQYTHPGNVYFIVGASLASFNWFMLLGFGARLLAPLFENPVAWRILDTLIAIMMQSIAITVIWPWVAQPKTHMSLKAALGLL